MGAIRWVASVAGAVLTVGLISVYGLGPMGVRPNAVSPEELEAFPYEGEWFPMPHAAAAVRPPALLRSDGRWAEAETDVPDVMQLARAEWPTILGGSLLGATATADTVTQEAALWYTPSVTPVYTRVLVQLELPDLGEHPQIDEAIFYLWARRDVLTFTNELATKVYTTTAGWSESDSASTLNGIALGTLLDSKTIDIDTEGGAEVSWDITDGVAAAYGAGATHITVIVLTPTYTDPPTGTDTSGLALGNLSPLGARDYHSFDTSGGVNPPRIGIQWSEGGGGDPDPEPSDGAAVNSGTVGVLLF